MALRVLIVLLIVSIFYKKLPTLSMIPINRAQCGLLPMTFIALATGNISKTQSQLKFYAIIYHNSTMKAKCTKTALASREIQYF